MACVLLPRGGLADAITPAQSFCDADAAKLLRRRLGVLCVPEPSRCFSAALPSGLGFSLFSNRSTGSMDSLSGYSHRPFAFVLRYLRRRLAAHVVIVVTVVAAVACSVGTQYGVKYLVDGLAAGPSDAGGVWLAFVFLAGLIIADNFLWRIASWTASFTFVGVTGDLRRDIFRHLTEIGRAHV